MAEPLSTNVTIEPCLEPSVYEYSLDGEKVKSTQSMSDHFTKILSRMELKDLHSEDTVVESSNEEERRIANGAKNTFGTFFEQMRQANIEVCALYDILSLVMSRRYFNLSANVADMDENLNTANPRQRELLTRQNQDILRKSWVSKRTSARQAADVLLSSYERFMKIINTTSGNLENFHAQLSNLRQRWKIRKQANTNKYLGDLSFRSAGSFYPYKMQFEVTKADSHKRTHTNSIDVIIPEELQVRVILKIEIETKDGEILLRTYSTMMANDTIMNTNDNSYDSILENAQRTVFLKELFSQLCREASDITNIIQPAVMRNSIQCWILSDVLMTISLLRASEFDASTQNEQTLCGANIGLLEYSLCALLRQQFLRNFHYSQLKPSTLMLGVPALRRIAGVNAFNYNQLKSISENKSILQTIIDLSQHQVVRARILNVLNNLATTCDINMTVNISAFSSTTSTFGRVHIIVPGYDLLCRWSYMFQIEECQVKIQYKSHLIEFQHHIEEVQRFFINQLACFKFTTACTLAKIFGWSIVGSTMAPTVGRLTEIQFSAQLDHSNISTSVGIRIGDDLQLQVAVRKRREQNDDTLMDDGSNERIGASKGIKYDPINLDDYCGTSTLQKFEMFISGLLHQEK
ncbi:unnamed protein product [Rotaria socialis]|uniref:Mediator of RNA polymerase II transcription subunit 17 n=1 Tax=Rotaria socialis TaxID=392032 RepID=A0A818XKT2_9BILA|nr:unnamed protein product [Rotaria socialis]CAF3268720.1 unnamed protein product [Rotaria socialis]CAF3353783.1 unnamed protein product [Rotaria socialis]CAF3398379.1 unnamed protein product [Rotaria socialis]CAF3741070.1 unnamed protein product [Rotaria socialis]